LTARSCPGADWSSELNAEYLVLKPRVDLSSLGASHGNVNALALGLTDRRMRSLVIKTTFWFLQPPDDFLSLRASGGEWNDFEKSEQESRDRQIRHCVCTC